ncbi:DUF808 domain-containing protein [Pseudoxanthomonas dokdonensis]|uniref:Membrane protein n=1 Tax=Pseudoxanthomonas dokdonensis TaxID=344882 RepID=A0A0R0CQ21_9GAMM|nr:DUF808 domain-containing protein [Pseudoxanthomonas dokdonensis]KRG68055.1 membrane protein [Pseudoxanthomonas dokdonensis]
MAGSSFFALLDDIATLLDDVSLMTKVAAKKTAGVLGDDLALNAQQVTGVRAERELPVVWAVAKGSLLNKVILVPAALGISALEGWLRSKGHDVPLITPLMMAGGTYLCFEGAEKLAHKFIAHDTPEDQRKSELKQALQDEQLDVVAFEKNKIKGAVRTDFILSAEIIVISLGTLAGGTLLEQLLTLAAIALVMTVGVYGLVGGIVKLDDAGLALNADKRDSGWAGFKRKLGRGILYSAPWLMKTLSVVGTAAMFLVGGGILVHSVPWLHHIIEPLAQGRWAWLWSLLFNALVGLAAGAVVLVVVKLIGRLRGSRTAH